ncbi:glycosyltransferase family 2 protein [Synechococcus sp. W4D4]|uniref:glycosyltransferase family 2 protein n=1 Tax=Synechococcus sp. W4D4 TaxID=3392294 RepID=UPI0039E88763
MTPWLSVIIPACNAEDYIEDCILSLGHIGSHIRDVFVINDASRDRTGDIARRTYDIPVTVIDLHAPSGPSKCRNIGLNMSDGSHVMFVDADDTIDKNTALLLEHAQSYDYMCGLHKQVRSDSKNAVISESVNWCGLENGDFSTGCLCQFERERLQEYMADYLRYPREYCLFEHCWGRVFKLSVLNRWMIRFTESAVQLEDVEFNLDYLGIAESIGVLQLPVYNHMIRKRDQRLSNKAGLHLDVHERLEVVSVKTRGLLDSSINMETGLVLSNSYKASKMSGYIAKICLRDEVSANSQEALKSLIGRYRDEQYWRYFMRRDDESKLLQFLLRYRFSPRMTYYTFRLRKEIYAMLARLVNLFGRDSTHKAQ